MADQFDRAQELDMLATEAALSAHQRQAAKAPKLVPTGRCLNPACDDDFDEPQRLFCGPGCCAEFARRTRK